MSSAAASAAREQRRPGSAKKAPGPRTTLKQRMKLISKAYGKTQHIPVRKNPAHGFSGGTHAQSDGGRSGWLLINRDPTTYFAKQYDYLSRHAETMDLQKVHQQRQREKEAPEQKPAQVAAEKRRKQRQANAKAHRQKMSEG